MAHAPAPAGKTARGYATLVTSGAEDGGWAVRGQDTLPDTDSEERHHRMAFIAWLGRRFVLVAYFTGVATFAGGTLGGFLSGSLCRAFTTSDGGERPQLAEAICGSFLRFGSVCLMTAVAIGLVLAWMAWRRSRSDRSQGHPVGRPTRSPRSTPGCSLCSRSS